MLRFSLLLLAALLLQATVWAQAPQAIKYQAVARDNAGSPISNQNISFRISILESSPTGPTVYSETHNMASNNLGLVNLDIGTGNLVSGNFSTIDWGTNTHFMKIEMDPDGQSNYQLMGTSQLLSVPYALHAATAGSVTNDLVDDADADPSNELNSNLNLNGNTLELTDAGGTITTDLSSLANDADADPANEYNTSLNLNSNTLELTDGGGTITADLSTLVDDADADPTNELQNLTLNNNTLSISNGNSVTLSSAGGGTLDDAYDFGGAGAGNTITVDGNPVQLNVTTASGIGLRADLLNTGTGIIASSNTSSNTFSSIQATTNSTSNIASAMIGSSSGNAWGVAGQVLSTGTAEAAIYGSNLRTTGGHGVMGIGYNGVVGQTNYSQGNAMYAENFDNVAPLGNGVGVAGKGYYGVLGEDRYLGTQSGAYGVFSNGNLAATGTKTFIIDHPQDPENKALRHFSIESNEVLNVYRGTAAFDANGEVTIQLPDYFEEINRNPSYQLTPIGGPGQLYIKSKIENNQFVIAGGKAGMEVSWEVKAERNDRYLQQHPQQREVEIEKRDGQKGKYFMPHLYEQSKEKAIFPSNINQQEQNVLNIQN